MTPRRHDELVSGLTGIAKKIYEEVPIQEEAGITEIIASLRRKGVSAQQSIIKGCLRDLKEKGLIREPNGDIYVRVNVRAPALSEPLTEPHPPRILSTLHKVTPAVATVATASEDAALFDRIASVAGKLRDGAKAMNAAADELEEIGLDFGARMQGLSGQLEALATLKAALGKLQ